MGEMFPGGNQPGSGMLQPNGDRRRQADFMSNDSYGSPSAMTPNGMQPGGNGIVSPADYNYSTQDYQNGQYSRGVTPATGENYGSQGDDISAPWNQSGTMQRNSRSSGQSQWANDAGTAQGRFAPSRQSGTTPRNFGAPPMYDGR
jgi:hypothetical protein